MKTDNLRADALRYHSEGRPGKIEVIPTKPYDTQRELSLAYSPGVAAPCLEIEKNPLDAYQDIADFTSGIDYTTAKIAVEILEDELDHEEDILSYQHDIAALKRTIDKMIR